MATFNVIHQGQKIGKASKALIFLHGRGGTAEDILRVASKICDDRFHIVAPQAPGNDWYPYSFLADEQTNEPWLSASINAVKTVIDETAQTIPKDQIYVLGFSQGACLALEVTARFAAKYGGVIAFSGGLVGRTINTQKYHGKFARTPVFIGNSDVGSSHTPGKVPTVKRDNEGIGC